MLVIGLAPIIAPTIGGLVLGFTTWRGIFVVLAAAAVVLARGRLLLPPRDAAGLPSASGDAARLARVVPDPAGRPGVPGADGHRRVDDGRDVRLRVRRVVRAAGRLRPRRPHLRHRLRRQRRRSRRSTAQLNPVLLRWFSVRQVLSGAIVAAMCSAAALLVVGLTGVGGLLAVLVPMGLLRLDGRARAAQHARTGPDPARRGGGRGGRGARLRAVRDRRSGRAARRRLRQHDRCPDGRGDAGGDEPRGAADVRRRPPREASAGPRRLRSRCPRARRGPRAPRRRRRPRSRVPAAAARSSTLGCALAMAYDVPAQASIGQVVGHVPEGDHLLGGDAELLAEQGQRARLGDVGGADLDQGAGRGPGRGDQVADEPLDLGPELLRVELLVPGEQLDGRVVEDLVERADLDVRRAAGSAP